MNPEYFKWNFIKGALQVRTLFEGDPNVERSFIVSCDDDSNPARLDQVFLAVLKKGHTKLSRAHSLKKGSSVTHHGIGAFLFNPQKPRGSGFASGMVTYITNPPQLTSAPKSWSVQPGPDSKPISFQTQQFVRLSSDSPNYNINLQPEGFWPGIGVVGTSALIGLSPAQTSAAGTAIAESSCVDLYCSALDFPECANGQLPSKVSGCYWT